MKKALALFAALTAITLWAPRALAEPASWDIDPAHSEAGFAVKHLAISTVRGTMGKVTGTATYDPKDLKATQIDATVDVTGISTRNEKRDEDLKSANFFDTAKYPTITFKSKKVEKAGTGKLKITGDLTMHGVTKEVVLNVVGPSPEVKDPWGNTRVAVTATTKINRKDFGLTYSKTLETGGLVVGNEVDISLDIEMIKKK